MHDDEKGKESPDKVGPPRPNNSNVLRFKTGLVWMCSIDYAVTLPHENVVISFISSKRAGGGRRTKSFTLDP